MTETLKKESTKNKINYNNNRKLKDNPTRRNILNSQQCKGISNKGICKLLTKDISGFCRFHKNIIYNRRLSKKE